MKKTLLLLAVVFFSSSQVWSQSSTLSTKPEKANSTNDFRIPLIGESAPTFTAESTNGTINFPSDYGRKWKLLFSHPQDFTPVCSTEIMELAKLQDEFDKLGVKLVVVSADPIDVHMQWKKAMENLTLTDNKKIKIKFPIVDDENIAISKEYGMLNAKSKSTKSVRGVFIIDPDNIIQALYFYPMNVGRSSDELLRVLSALQTTAKDNVMTPVNWKVGNDVLLHNPPKIDDNNPTASKDEYHNPAWFLWYKKYNEK
ncbi:MAG: redoxin domain-containing protein [Paludibacter sp.]|nr:redoxin domain-containing protein [Paludibacter sp.]